MISQLSATVDFFRRLGVRAEVNHLAFEPTILDALPPAPAVDIDVSFVGTVSPDHRQRIALLEAVAERYDLKLFGNPPQALPASSPLHRCFQGEVWGADMYQTLRRSRITLNSHIDMAGREAGNMRLFEATGVGAFLLTDFKDNLHTLFEPDREVAVWRSIDDCLAGIGRALGTTMAAQRSRAPAMRGRWRSIPIVIAPRRSSALSNNCGHGDETSPPRQADRQAHHQGHADPAAPFSVLDRLSGARRRRRCAARGRIVGRMACRAHGDPAGARLSEPDRRHEARRTAA